MQTRSPFFTPLLRNTCANWQTLLCRRVYVTTLGFSSGLFDSQIIAGLSPSVGKCLSRQLSVMFSLPFINHSIFGSLKFQLRTLSHFLRQTKFSATAPQKPS